MTKKQYVTVKIPAELAEVLDHCCTQMGYHSRAEIVDDAIRRFIESRTKSEVVTPGVPA